MKNHTILKELFLFLLAALPVIYLLINWSALPDQMPIHFELNGEPNGYGSKMTYIFLPLGIYLLMLVLPYIDPRKNNYEIFSDTYFKLRLILGLFFGVLDSVITYNQLHGTEKLWLFLPILPFLLFTLIGNYMGTIDRIILSVSRYHGPSTAMRFGPELIKWQESSGFGEG